MAKDKSKKKSVEKATKSANKAKDAIKSGKSKVVAEAPAAIVVSEHALDGEKPEWNAQLDALREADIAAGMNEKALRVQRAGRIRMLKKGQALPDHGGLLALNAQAGSMQLDVQTTTAPPLPEGMAPLADEQQAAFVAQQDGLAEAAAAIEEGGKLGKKQRKAAKLAAETLAAEQAAAEAQAEADRLAAAEAAEPTAELSKKEAKKAAKKLAKEQAAAAETVQEAFQPKAKGTVAADPAPKTATAAPAAGTRAPRTDPIFDVLSDGQLTADSDKEKVEVQAPRQYVNKNYGLRLKEKYESQFPGLDVLDDKFDPATQKFVVTFVLSPQS